MTTHTNTNENSMSGSEEVAHVLGRYVDKLNEGDGFPNVWAFVNRVPEDQQRELRELIEQAQVLQRRYAPELWQANNDADYARIVDELGRGNAHS